MRHHDIDFVEVDRLHDRFHFGFGEELLWEPGLPGLTEFLIDRERAAHKEVAFAIQLQRAPARHEVETFTDPDRLIASVLRDELAKQLMVLMIAVAEVDLRVIIHEGIKEVPGFVPCLAEVALLPVAEIPDHDRHVGLQFLQRVIHKGEFGVRITDKKHLLLFLGILFFRHRSLSCASNTDL
ncbi:unknown [Sutterella sp. CAG:351]|nr:unknown [Sutterella sp. CAG:351]